MKFTDQEIKDVARILVIHNGWRNWVYDDLVENLMDDLHRLDLDIPYSYPTWKAFGDHIASILDPIWGPHLDFQDPAPWFNREHMEGSYIDRHGEEIRSPGDSEESYLEETAAECCD